MQVKLVANASVFNRCLYFTIINQSLWLICLVEKQCLQSIL